MIPEPGIYEGIGAEEYFSWECFSKSMVHATMKSAKHLKQYLTSNETTEAKTLGSLVDAMLLEPEELKSFQPLPETYVNTKGKEMPFNLNSKDCKETYQEILDRGASPIKKAVWNHAENIVNGVKDNPSAVELLKGGKKQVALVWDDPETGIRCRGRLDNLGVSIDDLKTTKDASYKSFSRDVVNFGYHIQAGMYCDGYKILTDKELAFNFIAVESSAPYCCAVYTLDAESIETGRIRARIALERYKGYIQNDPNLTRGYSDYLEPMQIPTWEIENAFKEGDNVGI